MLNAVRKYGIDNIEIKLSAYDYFYNYIMVLYYVR